MKKPIIIKTDSILSKPLPYILLKSLLSVLGVIFIGFAIALNTSAGYGNDPISVFFDGIRVLFGLPAEQLGIASNIVCYSLIVLVLIFGRKHINIGTFIYTLTLGIFINLGMNLYTALNLPFTFINRVLTCTCGCLMLFLGVAIFIAVNFGLDPFTASVMIVKDKINKSYTVVKIALDLILLAIGFSLGGQVGVVTLITAIVAGPMINFFAKIIERLLPGIFKLFKVELSGN